MFSEEVKQEESIEQAQREGNMNFLGDCGGSQCTLQRPVVPFSQSLLCKRVTLEERDDDLNSVVASLTSYKRQQQI